MYYGLNFSSDMGESIQLIVDLESLAVEARSTTGGEWREWRRLDTRRNADGSLNETVAGAISAQYAERADKFSQPVKVTFTGDISGALEFDGSERNITCNVTIPGVPAAILQAIQNAIQNAIPSSSSYSHTDFGGG